MLPYGTSNGTLYPKNCTYNKADSLITELQSSVDKRVRGKSFVYFKNRHDYEINIRILENSINLRPFVELLAVQLRFLQNFELDDGVTND